MNILGSLVAPFREDTKAVEAEDELQHDLPLDKDPFTASQEPAPLPHAESGEDDITDTKQSTADSKKYYDVMSLDQYTANQAARAAREAEVDSRIYEPARAKRGPAGSQEGASPSNDAQTIPPKPLPLRVRPVALGKPRTSDHIIALHHLTDKHKFPLPEYEYRESGIKGAGTFAVRLRIAVNVKGASAGQDGELAELVVEDHGLFQSKKEAKSAISEKGVVLLKEKLEEIGIAWAQQAELGDGATPAAATLKVEKAATVAPADPNIVPGENPIGLLLEFCSAKSLPQPSYQLYALDIQRFACELEAQFPSAEPREQVQVDGAGDEEEEEERSLESLIFGSQTKSYHSKKAAKVGAAAAAIAHLRRAGQLNVPGSSPPRKRQRQVSSGFDNDTGMTVTQHAVDGLVSPTMGAEEDVSGDAADARSANQVHRLRLQLGLNNLEYVLKRTPGTAYYTGHAVFPLEGEHGFGAHLQGKVGELREEVFGKRQAKEAVAREVVGILQAEVDRRAEAAGKARSGQVKNDAEDSGDFDVAGLGNLVETG